MRARLAYEGVCDAAKRATGKDRPFYFNSKQTMKTMPSCAAIARVVALGVLLSLGATAQAQTDPLPSWNDGAAKKAIVEFVQTTTTQGSPNFVAPEERIATFDQDGTLWVEHPMYTQVMYVLERVPALVKAKPELAKVAPFSTVAQDLHRHRRRGGLRAGVLGSH